MTFVTEKEAKNRTCPESMARVHGGEVCKASACMAWRLANEDIAKPDGVVPDGEGWEKVGSPQGEGGAVTKRQLWRRKGGYCGLAGAPSTWRAALNL